MSLQAAAGDSQQLTGLTGWMADVIGATGVFGVGLLVAAENLVPPIPSEVVLALGGYLASEGELNVFLVVVAATVGSVLGALLLYWLGAALGRDRMRRLMDRIPLVDPAELDRAEQWFARHGTKAVLICRIVPVVRSLISIPAGAERLPLPQFILLTTVGSAVWNSVLVGAGYLLGSQWTDVERYSDWFNYAIIGVFVLLIARFMVKQARRRARDRVQQS